MDETFSYNLCVLKKTTKDDGIYYGISDSETGELIFESPDLAFTEAPTNLNQTGLYADLNEYRSLTMIQKLPFVGQSKTEYGNRIF